MKFSVVLFIYIKVIILFVTKEVELLDYERILGGNLVAYGDFTYQASILVDRKVICGGAIIDEYFVLTAAHCIYINDEFFEQRVAVLAGVNNLLNASPYRVIIPVLKIYVPANYNYEKLLGDIAVLRLENPLELNKNPYLSQLYLPGKESFVNEEAIVTGFGWDSVNISYNLFGGIKFREGHRSCKMRYAKTRIIDHDICKRWYKSSFLYFFTVSDVIVEKSHICARVELENDIGGICDGDSGSPLVYDNDTIIGITIGGLQACNEKYAPGLYTRISSYIDFIEKAMMNKVDDTMIYIESCF